MLIHRKHMSTNMKIIIMVNVKISQSINKEYKYQETIL